MIPTMNKKATIQKLLVVATLGAAFAALRDTRDPEVARLSVIKAGQLGNDGGDCYDYENYEGCKTAFTYCSTQTQGTQPELSNPGWWHCDSFRCDATHHQDVEVTCPVGYADPKVLPARLLSHMKTGLEDPYSLKVGRCKRPSRIKWCAGEGAGSTTTWVVMDTPYDSHAAMPEPCLGFQTQDPPVKQDACSRWFGGDKK